VTLAGILSSIAFGVAVILLAASTGIMRHASQYCIHPMEDAGRDHRQPTVSKVPSMRSTRTEVIHMKVLITSTFACFFSARQFIQCGWKKPRMQQVRDSPVRCQRRGALPCPNRAILICVCSTCPANSYVPAARPTTCNRALIRLAGNGAFHVTRSTATEKKLH